MKKIGFDIVEVSRFRKHTKNTGDHFLRKIFSKKEIAYCFTYSDPSAHFAGIFAAKEAASKALGIDKYPWIEIEIRHMKNGKPIAYKKNKRLPIDISISHTKNIAGAVALV